MNLLSWLQVASVSTDCLTNFCPCTICPRSWPTECCGLTMVKDKIVVDLPSELSSWLVWAVEFSLTAATSVGGSNVKLGMTDRKGVSSMKLLHRMACVCGEKQKKKVHPHHP
ncbi:hypothetical protein L345_02392, partial [Ophiophagus hannah]